MNDKNIHQRMHAVMQAVQYIQKDDRVKFKETSYKALSEEKVTSIVREQLVKNGIVIMPVSQRWERNGQITHVDVTYKICNIDNPEDFQLVTSCGDGFDTQDKGCGKAMTYAYKYMLLRTFAIPTGEDPDKICNEEIESNLKEEPITIDASPARCADCGSLIVDYSGKSGKEIELKSVTRYKRKLCAQCFLKLYNAEKEAAK